MTDRELMQMALDDLINIKVEDGIDCVATILALRARLKQPEQEPVAYLTKRKVSGTEGLLRADMVDMSAKNKETHDFIPLYTAPPKKEWVGLTDREISEAWFTGEPYDKVVRMLEALLKEKNA